ncbi:MAG: hypothetical protein V4736_15340 [Bdellovibrionota bacterium]
MEKFLEVLEPKAHSSGQREFIREAGHEGYDLHSWGVLDSVLKMISDPKEILQNPQRFMSYFISPEPPIENLRKTANEISFDVPLMADQYPRVTTYLIAAFEGLPRYAGKPLATCKWEGITITVSWQSSMEFSSAETERPQISPQLLEEVIEDLQQSQKDLEHKNRELQQRNEELMQAYRDLEGSTQDRPALATVDESTWRDLSAQSEDSAQAIVQNLSRLHDYMVRAQQLVTLLGAHSKNKTQVQEALRRVDWEYVKGQYPRTISESVEFIRAWQKKR